MLEVVRRLPLAFVWLAMATPVHSAPGDQLRDFLSHTRTISAFFQQEVRDPSDVLLSAGRGRVQLMRPHHMRWIYQAPEELELVADGENFWSYDPLLAQATVLPLAEVLSETPLLALLGSLQLEDSFEVVREYKVKGLTWTVLRARGLGASSGLEIGLRAGVLERLHFADQFGQQVRMRFELVQINPPLEASDFAYQPPAGTDILGIPVR